MRADHYKHYNNNTPPTPWLRSAVHSYLTAQPHTIVCYAAAAPQWHCTSAHCSLHHHCNCTTAPCSLCPPVWPCMPPVLLQTMPGSSNFTPATPSPHYSNQASQLPHLSFKCTNTVSLPTLTHPAPVDLWYASSLALPSHLPPSQNLQEDLARQLYVL